MELHTLTNDPSSREGKIANGAYFSFTITAAPGEFLDLDKFSVDVRRGTGNPDRFNAYASGDGFATSTLIINNVRPSTSATVFTTYEFNDLEPLTSLDVNEVEFRFVNSGSGTGTTDGFWYFDNITVQSVPEPSAPLLTALGIILFVNRRRRW